MAGRWRAEVSMESAAHTNPSLLSIRQQGRSPECVGGEHTSPCTQTDDVNERKLVSGKKKALTLSFYCPT